MAAVTLNPTCCPFNGQMTSCCPQHRFGGSKNKSGGQRPSHVPGRGRCAHRGRPHRPACPAASPGRQPALTLAASPGTESTHGPGPPPSFHSRVQSTGTFSREGNAVRAARAPYLTLTMWPSGRFCRQAFTTQAVCSRYVMTRLRGGRGAASEPGAGLGTAVAPSARAYPCVRSLVSRVHGHGPGTRARPDPPPLAPGPCALCTLTGGRAPWGGRVARGSPSAWAHACLQGAGGGRRRGGITIR